MNFREFTNERVKSFDDYKVDVYKFLKKKRKVQATFNDDEDWEADEKFEYKDVIVHYNHTSFNKPVYNLEWK